MIPELACLVFRDRDGAVDYRFAGQALPGGAVPLMAVRWTYDTAGAAVSELLDLAPGKSEEDAAASHAAIERAIAEAEAFS